MNTKDYAKNILLDRNCRRCIYYMLGSGDDAFCYYSSNGVPVYDIKTPKEFTCNNWRSELDYRAYVQEQAKLKIESF